jgi:hypothetical protein
MANKESREKKSRSDSYVVRLYHHEDAVGDALVGYVEDPQQDRQWSFRGLAELTAIFVGLAGRQRVAVTAGGDEEKTEGNVGIARRRKND